MVQGHEGPVGNHTADVLSASNNLLGGVLTDDEVLSSSGIEELDVRHLMVRKCEMDR